MTVDSVGEIDEAIDEEVEALLNETNIEGVDEDEDGERAPVGAQFVKEITAFYCELCEHYSADKSTLQIYTKKHCMQRSHLKAFLRFKEEDEKAKKRSKDKEKEKKKSESEHDKIHDHDVKEEKIADEECAETNGTDEKCEGEEEHLLENLDETEEQADDQLWEDVDKDLGDLLREVGPDERDEDDEEEEDESVLNIDIER